MQLPKGSSHSNTKPQQDPLTPHHTHSTTSLRFSQPPLSLVLLCLPPQCTLHHSHRNSMSLGIQWALESRQASSILGWSQLRRPLWVSQHFIRQDRHPLPLHLLQHLVQRSMSSEHPLHLLQQTGLQQGQVSEETLFCRMKSAFEIFHRQRLLQLTHFHISLNHFHPVGLLPVL